jgi:dihydroxyacid dehydratase/phosphogluconate dehydratase
LRPKISTALVVCRHDLESSPDMPDRAQPVKEGVDRAAEHPLSSHRPASPTALPWASRHEGPLVSRELVANRSNLSSADGFDALGLAGCDKTLPSVMVAMVG